MVRENEELRNTLDELRSKNQIMESYIKDG